MSTAVNFEITRSPLPLHFSDTPLNALKAFILRARARLTNVVLGTADLGPLVSDVGAWLPTPATPNIPAWYYWNRLAGENQPLPIVVYNSGFKVVANAIPSDNRAVTFNQDPGRNMGTGFNATNTIAYLEDLYIPRDTIILDTTTSNTLSIDAKDGETWLVKLHQDVDITVQTAFPEGKEITITVIDEEGGHLLTWAGSTSVQWPGGTAPPMPTTMAGSVVTAEFVIQDVNGTPYGYQIDRTPALPVSTYTIPPVQRNYGGGGGSPRGATKVLVH